MKVALLLLTFISTLYCYEAKVIKIYNGCIITVLSNTNCIKVRLWGIDSPEKTQYYGIESTLALSNLVFNKTVQIDPVSIDPFKKTIAFVLLTNCDTTINSTINFIQITNGGACTYFMDSNFKDVQLQFKIAEKMAKIEKIGMWFKTNVISPYEYRKQQLYMQYKK
jgi:endonuclease YncB( thermonuclease family)